VSRQGGNTNAEHDVDRGPDNDNGDDDQSGNTPTNAKPKTGEA